MVQWMCVWIKTLMQLFRVSDLAVPKQPLCKGHKYHMRKSLWTSRIPLLATCHTNAQRNKKHTWEDLPEGFYIIINTWTLQYLLTYTSRMCWIFEQWYECFLFSVWLIWDQKQWEVNHRATRTKAAGICLQQHIWQAVYDLRRRLLIPCSVACTRLCLFVHIINVFACCILPSVQSLCRFCLPDDLRGSAGSAVVLPPNCHLGYLPSTPTHRPGCPLQRQIQRTPLIREPCAACIYTLANTQLQPNRKIHITIGSNIQHQRRQSQIWVLRIHLDLCKHLPPWWTSFNSIILMFVLSYIPITLTVFIMVMMV